MSTTRRRYEDDAVDACAYAMSFINTNRRQPTMWEQIKKQPLMSALIFTVIVVAIYYLFSGLWAAGKIFVLERANNQLVAEREVLDKEVGELKITVAKREQVIEIKDKELTEANALLQVTAKKTMESRANLDKVATDAARIMGDDSPLSKDALRLRLCEQYNIPQNACQ